EGQSEQSTEQQPGKRRRERTSDGCEGTSSQTRNDYQMELRHPDFTFLFRPTKKDLESVELDENKEEKLENRELINLIFDYKERAEKNIEQFKDELFQVVNEKNLNAQRPNGEGPILIAMNFFLSDVFEVLLEIGCDINLPDNTGATPIHLAIRLEDDETFENIIQFKHVDINWQNKKGLSPLMLACMTGNVKMVESLINLEAKVDLHCQK
uniref:Uncharacterized protein n=1 Tax=Biomphalaria glabrata TaxID=6526 RepID=A0A2C9L346_BIOGL